MNKMNTHIEKLYVLVSVVRNYVLRRIWYNYYLKNYLEKKSNMKKLNMIRKDQKNNIKQECPLVSVLIATYNRSKILTERSIPSVLNQTYKNFELIIVGDNCTDDTESRVEHLHDKRIKFYNLSKHDKYPSNPNDRWFVAGVVPFNKAIELSSGDWIAPLDDDDEFSEDHIEVLLNYAIKYDYEMVYGKVKVKTKNRDQEEIGEFPPKMGKITHISAIYSSKLKFLTYDIES